VTSFNFKKSEERSFFSLSRDFDYAYDENVNTSKYPLKASSAENEGLEITFKKEFFLRSKLQPCIENAWNIHLPFEYSEREKQFNIFYGKSIEILITPQIIRSDSDLRKLKPEARQCYFEDERKLKYFTIYSKKLCENECKSFVLSANCNCTSYYLPRDDLTDICTFKSNECLGNFKTFHSEEHKHLYPENGVCNCLETCDSISYSYEILETRYNLNFSKSLEKETTLRFRFKDTEFFPLYRYQQFALKDFLSFAGGLLGLFAGISVLSLIELFYFFTVRLLVDIWRTFKT
jgi:acid-sensing ion channel, other